MLYVVGTPIGNLQDIGERAVKIFKEVHVVLAEDTRVAKKLLLRIKSQARLESFHEHTSSAKMHQILQGLLKEVSMALVTDAGSPGVSDPGAKFIGLVYKEAPAVKIIPIPGPSAVTAALSVSGFRAEKFCFHGYPPKKKGRKTFFKNMAQNPRTQVFFSTPYRIVKDLLELKEAGAGEREIFIAREMTKMFESYYRGSIDQVLEKIKKDPLRGEYTLVLNQES